MNFKEFLLDIFFPKKCVSCNKENDWLCQDCYSKIVTVNSPTCPLCKTLTPNGQFCNRCRNKTALTGIMIAAYYEDGPLKSAIYAYKYNRIKSLSGILGNLLINYLQKFPLKTEAIFMPVPLHKSRLRKRGFNQASLLAKEITRAFGYQYKDDILYRITKTKPQVGLSGIVRQENVKNAFQCKNTKEIKNKNIILVDDVCTTGATLSECAKELRKEKVNQIWGMVLARQ